MPPATFDPLAHCAALESALRLEYEAELAESDVVLKALPPQLIQKAGLGFSSLRVAGLRTALAGKCLIDLEPFVIQSKETQLPATKIRSGDCVALSQSGTESENGAVVRAVVHRVSNSSIVVALDSEAIPEYISSGSGSAAQRPIRLTRLANQTLYSRLSSVMEKLKKSISGSSDAPQAPESLVRVIMGNCEPSFTRPPPCAVNSQRQKQPNHDAAAYLNEVQLSALNSCERADELALIHGPPGTGKTQTVVHLIATLVRNYNERVLVCAPSNIAVDNIVERLVALDVPVIRLGHPARLLPSVLSRSLDNVLRQSDAGRLVADIAAEIDKKLAFLSKGRKVSSRERGDAWKEVRELRKELRERERRVLKEVLMSSRVIATTLSGASGSSIFRILTEPFDTVVIDECGQAIEPECWGALLSARRAILAGDHLQLPPTVKAKGENSNGSQILENTLFERLATRKWNSLNKTSSSSSLNVVTMLTTQYRMNSQIMAYPSKCLYKNKLIAHESVANRTLFELPEFGVKCTDKSFASVLVLVDTVGCNFAECVEENSESSLGSNLMKFLSDSKYNESEADIIVSQTKKLIDAGIGQCDIVVLSPYNAQVALIRNKLHGSNIMDVEVGSVDGMQGREKQAVLLSLVRSNSDGEIGFLREERRLNVAITRAMRHLFVVCDSETVSKSHFCEGLIEFMSENGEIVYPGCL